MYDQDGDDLRSSFTTYLAEGDKVNLFDPQTQPFFGGRDFDPLILFLVVSKWRFSKGSRILYESIDAKTRR